MPPLRPIAVLAAGALLVGGLAWAATIDVELPAPTGEHPVGRRYGSFGDARRVAYTAYHPALPGTGAVGPYLPASLEGPLGERDLGPFRFLPGAWGRVHAHALDGAQWAPGTFPLVVYAPGAETQPEYSSSLLVELASHGHVVVALSLPDITPFVAYEDGTVVESAPPAMPRGEEAATRAFEERVDLVARDLLDATAALAASEIAAHLDGRVALVGHSLGGAGAAEAAARDPGIGAVADLDGSLGDEARAATLARPALFVQDEGFVPAPDAAARRAFVDRAQPGTFEVLRGASHTTFVTDGNYFEEIRPFARDSDDLTADEAWRALSDVLIAFLDDAFAAG